MQLSHETIYAYLYVRGRTGLNTQLIRYLRQQRPRRRSVTEPASRRGEIPEMLSIEERPAEVADRTVPGHWEGDLIIGKQHQSAIGVLVERVTRLVILVHLPAKDAASVREAFAEEIKHLPEQLITSLTYDQGREMMEHRLLSQQTRVRVYFAHPHSPWERGTCENTNMLIRGFFPKGTDFTSIPRTELKWVQRLLNERPRQTLNWRTPAQAFAEAYAKIMADQAVALAP